MISELRTFGLQNLFVRTREPFFSNLRTFGLKNLRTLEPSNLRTFGLIGCNPDPQSPHTVVASKARATLAWVHNAHFDVGAL